MVREEFQNLPYEIENLITLQEAIELTKEKGIVRPSAQIRVLTRNGKIKTVRMEGQRYLQKEQLEKWLSESLFSIVEVDKKPSDFISISKAVKKFGYSKERFNVLAYNGKVRAVKYGKHLFLDINSLLLYLEKNKSVLPDGYIPVHQAAQKIKEIRPEYNDYLKILRRLYKLTNKRKIDYIVANYDRCVPIGTIESVRDASSDLYKELFS